MDATTLTALCPLDGRYAEQVKALHALFCEQNMIKERLQIEIAWLKTLSNEKNILEITPFQNRILAKLDRIVEEFSLEDAMAVKAIEKKTHHDVKALEYWLKNRLAQHKDTQSISEFVHFACTSEDINNLCYGVILKKARDTIILPNLDSLIKKLSQMAKRFAKQPMVGRTHGQVATPTTLGKELANIVYRLNRQRQQLVKQIILGKINGAVGNYNAHYVAYPNVNWEKKAKHFVETLGLSFNPYTTQIEPHDYMAELYQILVRINTILIDLCRDLWGYMSLGYFVQETSADEVGSSTMPHKINPIDFENAEGNLGLANALLQHFSEKLPISRFQRDLTDSTVLRNIGMSLGYTLLSYQSCLNGLTKLHVQPATLNNELTNYWILLAEPIQTVMRRYGLSRPYEKLKALTHQKEPITQEKLAHFINQLSIPEAAKKKLLALTPANYLGHAEKLAQKAIKKNTR